jgi:hypothetical protein
MAATAEAQYYQRLTIGVTVPLLTLSYVTFTLRLLSRRLMKAALWLDDWLMLLAVVSMHIRGRRCVAKRWSG